VTITVVPQEPDIGDAVGIIANLTLDPGQTCTKMECWLKDLTCGYQRGPFTMFQDSPTRWHGNWQTLDGHNGGWRIEVKAYFSPGSTQATAVKLVDVGNLVLDDLEPDRPILWTNDTTDLPPAFSCYVFNHVPLPVGMELQIYDTDYGPPWGKSESVSPNTTWSVQPPAGTLEKYHIYSYKFWGQQNYADWYTNPRPIFNSLSAYLAKPVDPPFDPDEQEMWANLEYQLGEQAASLDWDAYDPLLNELTPLASPPPAMPTGPPGQALVCPGDVDLSWPIYGGRYHWVVSGMASKMERDHVFLPIKDEGACIVMQPKARNYDLSGWSPGCAGTAAVKQHTLDTEVPEGEYGATGWTDPDAVTLKQAFEEAAIWFYAGHGVDNGAWAGISAASDAYLATTDPGRGNPQDRWVSGPGGLVNPTQCHLAVIYACEAGQRFAEVLGPQGVECVVGVGPQILVYGGDIAATWTEVFWENLRQRGQVQCALNSAKLAVFLEHGILDDEWTYNDYWSTDLLQPSDPSHRIWLARYE